MIYGDHDPLLRCNPGPLFVARSRCLKTDSERMTTLPGQQQGYWLANELMSVADTSGFSFSCASAKAWRSLCCFSPFDSSATSTPSYSFRASSPHRSRNLRARTCQSSKGSVSTLRMGGFRGLRVTRRSFSYPGRGHNACIRGLLLPSRKDP